MIYCRICKDHFDIKGFDRDDPVLDCGHIKRRTEKDDMLDLVKNEVEELFRQEADDRDMSIEEVRTEFVQSLLEMFGSKQEAKTIGYCETCGTVTVRVGRDGVRRCAGNLVDNPGCGMPVDIKMKNSA